MLKEGLYELARLERTKAKTFYLDRGQEDRPGSQFLLGHFVLSARRDVCNISAFERHFVP